ncbi:unnamed protein product [Orchesella dallaii]|uniref:CRAL-TRIO domain-containing protein n=1 Tax=Orchesella dallaii TaxID=48710 RepID=A0ABP1R2K5_9HEXA
MGNSDIECEMEDGLKEMRKFYEEFKIKNESSQEVRDFLANAFQDEALLSRFLRGRKFRTQYAWDTLRRYAETRFDTYPDIFTDDIPKSVVHMRENLSMGFLKQRDKEGRRIAYFKTTEWDADKATLKDVTAASVRIFERLLHDEDGINNGIVFIQECSGMTLKHATHYTLPAMLRIINLYWYAYPVKLKAVYFVNFPYILTFLYRIVKPFLPKKLKERLLLTPPSRKFEDLHKQISPDKLPKCLGGHLELEEAADLAFLDG